MATQSFAYHAHGTADSDKFCCYLWFVCHDKTLDQQCMLGQASPLMINHLTSKNMGNNLSKSYNTYLQPAYQYVHLDMTALPILILPSNTSPSFSRELN